MGKRTVRTEQTVFHQQIADYHASPQHFLVSPRGVQDQTAVHGLRDNQQGDWVRPFDCIMVPEHYSEVVSVAALPGYSEQTCVSYVDLDAWDRWKETVRLSPGLRPSSYRSSLIVYQDCTKKKYVQRVDYQCRLTPHSFTETRVSTPRQATCTYVSFLDLHVDGTRKWFTSAVDLKPKTFSSTLVQDFEYCRPMPDQGPEEEDGEQMNGVSSADIHTHTAMTHTKPRTDVDQRVKYPRFTYPKTNPALLNGYLNDQPSLNGQVNGYAE